MGNYNQFKVLVILIFGRHFSFYQNNSNHYKLHFHKRVMVDRTCGFLSLKTVAHNEIHVYNY